MFGGDFIGISRQGLEDLITQISIYIDAVNEVIQQFNAEAETTETFKGTSIEGALKTFFDDSKRGLTEYVLKLEIEKDRAKRALEEWEAGEKGVSQTVTSSADAIRSDATSFSLE